MSFNETDNRKISDVVLDIEKKVQDLGAEVKLISSNLKIILQRSNLILEKVSSSVQERSIKKEAISASPVQEQKKKIKEKSLENIEQSKTYKEITVSQKVLYPDGSPVILALVKILDLDKNDVTKSIIGDKPLRTFPNGKWSAIMKPGNYFIKIMKEPTNSKPMVDRFFEIEILNNKGSLELKESKE